MYLESKIYVQEMENVLAVNAKSFERSQREVNRLEAANHVLAMRLGKSDLQLGRNFAAIEDGERNGAHLKSKIDGLEKWGRLMEGENFRCEFVEIISAHTCDPFTIFAIHELSKRLN